MENKQSPESRCPWPAEHQLAISYHDHEWGVPVHEDKKHFEFLLLDGFQAGLSWNTILNKRENFRNAFDNFDYHKIAQYTDIKKADLMDNQGIIRNRLKIEAAVINARAFIKIIEEYGSFDSFIWKFVDNKTIINKYKAHAEIPASSKESDAMSKALKKAGFKFVGTTICYAYMQAAGMVNDHLVTCFRYNQLNQIK
jgi:DNA-3-methyladenine glycosylase I